MLDKLPGYNELSQDMQTLVSRLLLVLAAVIIIWIMRRVVTWILVRPLRRITRRIGYEQDDILVDAILPPMRYFVVAAALLVSARILEAGDSIIGFVENLGRSIIVLGLILLLNHLIDLFATTSARFAAITGISIEERLLPFFRTGVKIVNIAIGVVIIVQVWGYDISGLIAGIGIGGLAVSLAAQDTIANLFGFTAIVGDRPFNVGEYIVTPDVEGVVEHVGIRSTRVRRLDQALVTVPNNKLANSAILNWSRLAKRRIDYILGVTYDASSDDLRLLLHRIREMLNARPTIEPESVVVYFLNFGDNALEILIRAYVRLADWAQFTAEKEQINLEIMDIVAELNLAIAFPSRSLYIENMPEVIVKSGAEHISRSEIEYSKLSPRERALLREEASRLAPPAQHPGGEQDIPDGSSSEQDIPDKS